MDAKTRVVGVVVLVLLFGSTADVVANGFLYGAQTSGNLILRIDPTDASYDSIGSATFLDGLTYNSDDGFLYGAQTGGNLIFRIDPTDASYQSIGSATFLDGLAYIPEPTTISLLALAALAAMRRSRRLGAC